MTGAETVFVCFHNTRPIVICTVMTTHEMAEKWMESQNPELKPFWVGVPLNFPTSAGYIAFTPPASFLTYRVSFWRFLWEDSRTQRLWRWLRWKP